MDNLTILYDDVFSILPISYSGITDFEVELNKFLQKLAESNFIKYNPNITLLFSAMLQFPDDKNKASQWELESLKKIFYKTFVEGDERGVINFYFGLLNKFSFDNELGDYFSMTKTLSKFFIQPVDFKISLDEHNDEPLVYFDRRNDVFNISLPQKILFSKLKHASRHKEINDLFKINDLRNDNFTSFDSRYEFKLTGNKTVIDLCLISTIFQEIYDITKVDEVAKNIIEQLNYLEDQQNKQLKDFQLPKIFEKQDECCYKKIAYGAIAISFICYYYDSSLEYLLSIGNLKNENGTSRYQNLGGLVLGYYSKTKLSDYERTIFNIISDRLSSVLVCQSLHKENIEIRIETNRKLFKNFCMTLNGMGSYKNYFNNLNNAPNFLHGNIECKQSYSQLIKLIQDNKSIIGNSFIDFTMKNMSIFSKYLSVIHKYDTNNNEKFKTQTCFDHCDKGNCTYCRLMINGIKSIDDYYLNFPLIDSIISEFERKDGTEFNKVVSQSEKLIFNYSHEFNPIKFYEKLISSGTTFVSVLKDNADAILAMGNFQIELNSSVIFDLEKWKLLDNVFDKIAISTNPIYGFNLIFTLSKRNR